jgi:hypothetical protein
MGSVVVRQGSGSLLPATPDGRGGRPRCQIRKRWISDRMGSTSVVRKTHGWFLEILADTGQGVYCVDARAWRAQRWGRCRITA